MEIIWQGIYPAITTQFHKDGSLDFKTFGKNLKAQMDAGIHGVIIGGSLGEASTLKYEEKFQIAEYAMEISSGRIPVIINIAEQSTEKAVQTAKDVQALGASGLMMLPPMGYKADARETVAHFKAVAASTDLPILVYNNPVDYNIEVTLDMFEELIEYDNIQAVKDSTRDVSNVTRIFNCFGDRIKILCGVDTLALESLMMGAHGWVGGLVNAFPNETVAIYELVKAGRFNEALAIHRWFLPLLELDVSSKLVQNIKLAEVATSLGSENVRPPRLPLAGRERERVQRIIDNALKIKPEIPVLS